ncbi:universal stress protein [Cupriavidus necator]|uniref:universal stress protein n=1 Tax=Cupriavidus necator TaxID=106590 RepID=UPI0039C20C56
MFKHFLLPIDGSPLPDEAFHKIIIFARETGARITVLQLISSHDDLSRGDTSVDTMNRLAPDAPDSTCGYFNMWERDATAAGIKCDTIHAFSDKLNETLIKTAEDNGCDLILVASSGWGVRRLRIDSEGENVEFLGRVPLVIF